MKKIFLVVFLVIMGLLGCLVSCSRDDGEYTTGTLVIEVDYWSAYWNNKLYVRIYPLGQEKLGAIKVLEFGNKHSVSVDLNPGNYSVNVVSTSGNGAQASGNPKLLLRQHRAKRNGCQDGKESPCPGIQNGAEAAAKNAAQKNPGKQHPCPRLCSQRKDGKNGQRAF